MIAQRAAYLLAGAASLAALAVPATAQVDDGIVLDILRNCAQIDDPTARLACFDNNIRAAGVQTRRTVPGQVRAEGGTAPIANGGGAQGFGREDVRTRDRFLPAPAGEMAGITAEVTGVRRIGPGLWELTLDSGAVWKFTDGVPNSYSPPQAGSQVEIDRASMGSFLMRFNNQESVRVERVR